VAAGSVERVLYYGDTESNMKGGPQKLGTN